MVIIGVWDTWGADRTPVLSSGYTKEDAVYNHPLWLAVKDDDRGRYHVTSLAPDKEGVDFG